MTETAATLARQGNPQDLAHALHSARSDTLSLFADFISFCIVWR